MTVDKNSPLPSKSSTVGMWMFLLLLSVWLSSIYNSPCFARRPPKWLRPLISPSSSSHRSKSPRIVPVLFLTAMGEQAGSWILPDQRQYITCLHQNSPDLSNPAFSFPSLCSMHLEKGRFLPQAQRDFYLTELAFFGCNCARPFEVYVISWDSIGAF